MSKAFSKSRVGAVPAYFLLLYIWFYQTNVFSDKYVSNEAGLVVRNKFWQESYDDAAYNSFCRNVLIASKKRLKSPVLYWIKARILFWYGLNNETPLWYWELSNFVRITKRIYSNGSWAFIWHHALQGFQTLILPHREIVYSYSKLFCFLAVEEGRHFWLSVATFEL